MYFTNSINHFYVFFMTPQEVILKVRVRCHRMHNYLRAYYGKPIGPMVGLNQSDFRYMLDNPCPTFYQDLYNLYHYAHIEFDDNLLIEFKNAVFTSHSNKKRKP